MVKGENNNVRLRTIFEGKENCGENRILRSCLLIENDNHGVLNNGFRNASIALTQSDKIGRGGKKLLEMGRHLLDIQVQGYVKNSIPN